MHSKLRFRACHTAEKEPLDRLCRAEYRLVAKKGEGTFSEVLKAQCIKNSKYVAIKCMKNHFDSLEQASWMSLRCTRHIEYKLCQAVNSIIYLQHTFCR